MNPSVIVLHIFFNSELITSNLPPDMSKEISEVSMGLSHTIFNLQEYSNKES